MNEQELQGVLRHLGPECLVLQMDSAPKVSYETSQESEAQGRRDGSAVGISREFFLYDRSHCKLVSFPGHTPTCHGS